MKSNLWKVSAVSLSLFTAVLAAEAAEMDPLFTPYGFINASYWAADHSVGSIVGLNRNFSAPAAAASDGGSGDRQNLRARSAFQVQQSRFGLLLLPKSKVHGKFEFDFFNSGNAAPLTASVLRLRIAKIEWQSSESTTVFLGQDWDLFNGGVNPHTHNWVGNYFQGGNVGYIRQQVGFSTRSDEMEYGFALGQSQNTAGNTGNFATSNSDSDFSLPTVAVRVIHTEGKNKFGASGIYAPKISATTVSGADTSNSHEAFGTALFADTGNEDFTLHAKLYWGQNFKDIGSIGISSIVPGSGAFNAHSTHEYGGFLSVAHVISTLWGTYGGVGFAKISDAGSVAIDGLDRNWQFKLGGEYIIPETKAKAFLELTRYSSEYNVAAGPTQFVAYTSQVGVEMPF